MDIDFSLLVNALTEGVYVVDPNRRIIFWSKGAEKITGWKAEEVVGSFCSDGILEHKDAAGHALCHNDFCPLHRAMISRSGQKTASIVYSLTRSKKRIPVEVTTAPYLDARGRLLGGIEVFRDISETVADMQAASLVQRGAITVNPPAADGMRFEAVYNPREIVGGDFYRIERISDHACSLFLADVTSHGVSAALSTLLLRSLWDQLGAGREPPVRVAQGLNVRLAPYASASGFFASALAGTLDAAAGELRFCSMGSPPFLQLSAGGELRIHAFPGSLLGVDAALEYEQEAIGVEPGDRLLFFTDGAFEAQGLGAVPYGVERLADRFRDIAGHPALADFCTSLQQDILDQTGLLRLPDDFTVILATLG